MKYKQQVKARLLRSQGLSLKEIIKKLKVSKSSVSLWVREVKLTSKQEDLLTSKGKSRFVIEQRRKTRLQNERAKRQIIIDAAQKEIKKISKRELWLLGTALYWGEGGKTQRGLVRFSNSDPEMIKMMMVFFRKICKVPENKFRCYIHIHPHLDHHKAEKFWSKVTGIPLKQFFKTYRIRSKAGKHLRDNLPCGTADVYICDTKLFLKISGWTKGIYNGIKM